MRDMEAAICAVGPAMHGAMLARVLQHCGLSLDKVAVITGGPGGAPNSATFETVVFVSEESGALTTGVLAQFARVASPGASVVVIERATDSSKLKRCLVMAGYVGATVEDAALGAPDGSVLGVARAKKAGYAPGAVDAVAPSASTAAPRAANPFLASNGDDDLIDDETLLLPEDLQRPQVGAVADGCATKRKACKNCTCGRAEREKAEEATGAGVKVNLTDEQINNPTSACGSCSLGDAFRCATCPYRGLPPFKPGEKIQLAVDLLASDF